MTASKHRFERSGGLLSVAERGLVRAVILEERVVVSDGHRALLGLDAETALPRARIGRRVDVSLAHIGDLTDEIDDGLRVGQ